MTLKIYAAPLQGFTEAPWRNIHAELFGGVDAYYTPFIRVERGEVRHKDLRDIAPENNTTDRLVPQFIASTAAEAQRLIRLLADQGYTEADLNLGCPFPLLAAKHKGAGLLPYPQEVKALLDELAHYPEMRFSVKMRLGWADAKEWRMLLPLLNEAQLSRIVLHPRIGKQQYKGEPDREAFAEFARACAHPIIYNGDLHTADEIQQIAEAFPQLEGIMLGRGLLANPALALEWRRGEGPLSAYELRLRVKTFHERLFHHYSSCLQGDAQLLSKMKPYWEYFLPDLNPKIRKAIHKATRLDKYLAAVASV